MEGDTQAQACGIQRVMRPEEVGQLLPLIGRLLGERQVTQESACLLGFEMCDGLVVSLDAERTQQLDTPQFGGHGQSYAPYADSGPDSASL